MAKPSTIAYFIVVLAVVVNLMVQPSESLSCSDISGSLGQCASYASGSSSEPSGGCCGAVKQLGGMAQSTEDRRQLCSCLKQSAAAFPNIQLANVAAIPQKCGVPSASFSIDPSVDCNS